MALVRGATHNKAWHWQQRKNDKNVIIRVRGRVLFVHVFAATASLAAAVT